MKKFFNKLFSASVTGCMVIPTVCFTIASCGSDNTSYAILFTNDVHAALVNKDTNLSYAKLKGYRNNLESNGIKTLLVDSGDFASGGVYGSISKGQYMTRLMNACQYDLVIPGNHDYDFGMDTFKEIAYSLNCPIISSNFYRYDPVEKKATTRILDDTKVLTLGKKKIGFVGVTTPDTIGAASPKVFQNESGERIYSFLNENNNDPAVLYATLQASIDSLKEQKCDVIVGLSHLGIYNNSSSRPFSSESIIKHTHGLNVLLDGHSHTVNEKSVIKDDKDNNIILSQTGTGFQSFGQLTIKNNNDLDIKLVKETNVEEDVKVANAINNIKEKSKDLLDIKLGKLEDFDLVIYDDDKDKTRIVRRRECNAGDFYADGLAYAAKNDSEEKEPIAIINGGGVRANINRGDVMVKNIIDLSPFSNSICRVKVKGSILRDALEFCVSSLKKDATTEANILQVSSRLKYTVNLDVPSPVIFENGVFKKVDETKSKRVTSIKVDGEEIDLNKQYSVAGCSFMLLECGSGFTMFKDQPAEECPVLIDYEGLSLYFKYAYENNLLSQYSNKYGQGRISINYQN